MADVSLRELERTWRSSGEGLEALEAAYARVGRPLPHEVLAATPRWAWLAELARTAYESELDPAWGHSAESVAAAEAHPGLGTGPKFPRLLREWFRLVGLKVEQQRGPNSGRWARDLAALTARTPLSGHSGLGLRVWSDPRARREVAVPLGGADDAALEIRGGEDLLQGGMTLGEWLALWTYAESANALWIGPPYEGPLGALRLRDPALLEAWLAKLGGPSGATIAGYWAWRRPRSAGGN